MDNQLGFLYQQVREKTISQEEALKQIKEFKAQYSQKSTPLPDRGNDHNVIPEVYVYDEPYLKDHTVYSEQVLIGATHGSLAIDIFFRLFPQENNVELQRLNFIKPIEVKKDQSVEVVIEPLRKGAATELEFQAKYRYGASPAWDVAATGNLQASASGESGKIDLDNIKNSLAELPDFNQIYTSNPAVGLGDSFKTITQIFTGQDRVLARVVLSQTTRGENHKYVLHPLIINSAFQAVNSLLGTAAMKDGFLPFGIKNINCQKNGRLDQCWLLITLVKNSGEMIVFDAEVIDDDFGVVARLAGCSVKRLRSAGQVAVSPHLTAGFPELQQQNQTTSELYQPEKPANTDDLKSKIKKYLTNKLSKIIPDRSRLQNSRVNLMDLGLESSQLMAMTDEIKQETSIELYPTLFFEYPNIEELTEFFSQEHQEPFSQLLGIDAKQAAVSAANRPNGQNIPAKAAREVLQASHAKVQIPVPVSFSDNAYSGNDDIAIIGMHGLFAESSDLNQFWHNLRDKKDLIKEIPIDHWDYRPWYDTDPEAKNKTYSKWGSFIDDVDKFDAGFFNISGREAEWMDPQLRLLLQSIYAAGEDAGYINQLRGTDTGVFVGVCFHDYADKIAEMNIPIDPYLGTGNAHTVIANRVSFLFDFTGPSMAVDTACSSSLFALHYACRALRNKECNTAFVGGVNLLLASAHYRYFCSIGALSSTGRCHTFDEAADGYVPGECIASILLKPLQQAIKDGDHIYAVIKGSAALHGGYTPSLTAPSVEGEENVILKAWEDAGINPETLTYIEAHGTGTKLGDPIEINSLKKAFKRFTNKEQFCAVGSAKAHIGHTEGGAGIAGIIKVILQIKQKQIPAMPQFKKMNPYIQLAKSALYINQEIEEWKSPPGAARRAGVSSFGFSGAYAHVVLEEYIPVEPGQPSIAVSPQNPAIIVLSAKSEEGLRRQAQQLLAAIRARQYTDNDLAAIAYTLQVGREAMEERLGIIAGSVKELEDKLQGFAAGKDDKAGIEDVYLGQVKRNREALAVLAVDEEMAQTVDAWISKGKYDKFLQLWVKGLSFDWNKLYGDARPGRISLPTYPFAKERYWVQEGEPKTSGAISSTATAAIHPLLQQNTSDFYEQRFSSTFTGREFFLADHVMKGQRVLPGVAYLEMARAAVEQAAGTWGENQTGIRLKNVVWARPITVGEQPQQVHIGLSLEENGDIIYEIYSEAAADGAETVMHSQGKAALITIGEVPTLDLPALTARCSQNTLSPGQCYRNILATGLAIGPSLQGIEALYLGPEEILAKLALPAAATEDRFFLHPSLMDAALQATSGLIVDYADTGKPCLPFAIEELEIFGPCAPAMWALVRQSDGNKSGDKIRKFHIDLCDNQGNVCVRIKDILFRILDGEPGAPDSEAAPAALMIEPTWREEAIAPAAAAPEYDRQLVILCEPDEVTRESITAGMNGVHCLSLHSQQAGMGDRFQDYAGRVFEEMQHILNDKPAAKVLVQIVVKSQGEQRLFSGLAGLLNTGRLENTKLIGQIIEIEPGENAAGIIAKLKENSLSQPDKYIRYQNGKRHVAAWREIKVAPDEAKIPWQDRGIYLITGGAGGLGLIFAAEIAQQVKDAVLILTGRSPLNEGKAAKLNKLEALGARVIYKQADVTQKQEVADLIQSIQADFGGINGIIHAAGVLRDNFILKKTQAELQEVLAPKVAGLVNLDQAAKDLTLDFFILFSSIAGSLGNPGQADYAAANAFMDAYARYRHDLTASKQRRGQTLSVNWPLWQEGGMRIDAAAENMMRQTTGMTVMRTSTGLRALYQALAAGVTQCMVTEGNLARMKQKLLWPTPAVAAQPAKVSPASHSVMAIDAGSLPDKVQAALVQAISKLLKVKSGDIDPAAELSNYGFDSITLTEFANKLNKEYKLELTPAIFFEHPTIHSFAGYLIKEHQAVFAAQFAVKTRGEIPAKAQAVETAAEQALERETEGKESLSGKGRRSRLAKTGALAAVKLAASTPEPVVIVGVSGKFPLAGDINEFWQNLRDGKDCITEIPADRWDWREYYGDPVQEENKTNIKWGGFIDGVAEFDPLFFGISPREAMFMDPQQRLLMTYVWKAIEDAGYAAQSLAGTKTGIFVGTSSLGYSSLIAKANMPIEGYTSTGMAPSVGPNRMSYFLNIHGPSEPIETACSSSLIAIHRAVSAIESGNCEMAIVGGINTIVTPDLYISFNKAGMLCEDGRCKTFSNQANGYVRGEGVGMLFLKKLKDAEAAGDHIYGIIRSTAENHGGRANSLTSPNPKAQADLLQTAYAKAGIDPRTVSYIEAHGTGTELGDPIEINGLKTAFRELYRATGDIQTVSSHCGLGSVKSNIGHLELAAGIAGVIKVLLQLKHKTLVKSLHCDTINPYIQLKDSPFYVVQESKEWQSLQDDQGQTIPRRAGVSSFGFGGANAHVVIEEYIPKNLVRSPLAVTAENPAVIVLSAKNEDRLREQARQLLLAIREQQLTDRDLADIAYTLQVGREPMEERLGLMAGSMKELEEKLGSFVDDKNDKDDIKDLYQGQAKRNKDTVALFAADEDLQNAIELWISKGKYEKLLNLWVKGLILDWNKLYGDVKPRRLSLPTYPFARERYWVQAAATQASRTASTAIYPLLQQSASDFYEQQFSSTFTGQEFFLADHVVNGQRVLPGVAYLEIARAAVEQAAGTLENHTGIQLKNVVWVRPIIVGEQPVKVHIGLFPEDNGEIAFEVYSESKETGAGPVVHSQGRAVLSSVAKGPALDLAALQAQCSQSTLSSSQYYEAFRAAGIDYGPAHQGIETVYVGTGQVLAKLSLPASVAGTQAQFFLHPSLLDSALQASAGFMFGRSTKSKQMLPFAIEEIEILERCTPVMWSLIRFSDGSGPEDKVQKFDIDLYDDQGEACVRMTGFTSRVVEGDLQAGNLAAVSPAAAGEPLVGTIMLTPVWDAVNINRGQVFPSPDAQVVIAGGDEGNGSAIRQHYPHAQVLDIQPGDTIEAIGNKLAAHGSIDHMIWVASHHPLKSLTDEALIAEQGRGVFPVFRTIKALLRLGYGAKNLGWTVITTQSQAVRKNDGANPTHASLHGLIGSMAREYPNWKVRLVDIEPDGEWTTDDIFALPSDSQGELWVGRGREWYRQKLVPVRSPAFQPTLYKPEGVYVVIGGAGGIGEVWTEYMIRNFKAKVVWLGRRQKDEAIQAKLDRLAALGSQPGYFAADAANQEALQRAYEEIKSRYGKINGVIHSAIVLLDQSLANMDEERFQAALAAKVDVSVRIAQIFRHEPLDFVLFFSSINSFTKSPGQSNYVAGCAFKDAFARQLAREWDCAVKVINWGYWGNAGIVASPGYRARMEQAGIGSIEPAEGMVALETLLAGQINQIALLKTTKPLAIKELSLSGNTEEWITVYPEQLPSQIYNLKNRIETAPKPGGKIQLLKIEGGACQ
ncbi:MAG TPA: SDR family NAD(P)-dependent oxidoreductase [Methylomusa anaerophila]|uniref:Polyketide synthase PksN n=1 Tax=Methylomusa anaerophila TaxID=1930071 RepID=A0A348AQU2_9FIRM|nr:SDR family NAD(P)-dependent oxidoreductase [Methylomusa anaerophila]BBB93440.1 polyketide synthase PksN [Methylomusa anaerophila]HML90311.1 SDR family NAD(P)-dependent oxidoreductase [Methylomusa anaerophila]